jgi:hypothetical protein
MYYRFGLQSGEDPGVKGAIESVKPKFNGMPMYQEYHESLKKLGLIKEGHE